MVSSHVAQNPQRPICFGFVLYCRKFAARVTRKNSSAHKNSPTADKRPRLQSITIPSWTRARVWRWASPRCRSGPQGSSWRSCSCRCRCRCRCWRSARGQRVFTSNIAATEIINLQHSSFATIERHVLAKAQQSLRPELYARIAEKLVFNRLSYEVQMEIGAASHRSRTFISSRQRVSPDGRPRSCLVPDATRFSSTIGSASVARHD
jgi:hypothetical protein